MKNSQVPSNLFTVAPGVWGRKDVFVNFFMIQDLVTNQWVLVDTGLKWSASKIKEMASYLFGDESTPKAIILTHGHFDHVGSVVKLADEWDVSVFAHHLEIPYLTGHSDYPPPDPTVGGGLMARMAFLYPNGPINIWRHLKVLPADGKIPVLPEWRYVHTPGHAPGHISLFRESDGVLIAGDAFATTKQESAISVMLQTKVISGPPKYFTYDWQAAKTSVSELVKLQPKTAATGHGMPMRGKELQKALKELQDNFDENSIPATGRYIANPAITNANGVMYIPPKKYDKNELAIKVFAVTTMLVLGFMWKTFKKNKRIRQNEDLLEVEYNY
ncbi:MBL fold metallo-hydrolase [Segetibacter sp.]|uniref:MBL fold metallo-hydrolase n=1 Tax=Segetibacter sp. TaxID=2231182 RepID=UPI00260E5DDC|nr:MBL fold metallo-hydrolase [Segetibacter sp.]MCW3081116.1 beta-lactamase domain protein [Segetibacter sp.]